MQSQQKGYTVSQTLRELITDNSLLLMAVSRFGLPLRLANATVAEVCASAGTDADTFVCVANMVSGYDYDVSKVDLPSLMSYLKRAHTFFLDFFLPVIRRKIISAIDYSRSHDTALLIMRFYDEYVEEVRRHMSYEDTTLFRYIDALLAGEPVDDDYSIAVFASHHDAISEKLSRLKDVLIRYSPDGDANMLNSTLFDIINCEADLISHCQVEDKILVPAVERLERTAVSVHRTDSAAADTESKDKDGVLGRREKEIVCHIARGLSNKEIADRMCISVHTVTTHRRNICAKLDIHSSAGLTIYAILNGFIDPKEVKEGL